MKLYLTRSLVLFLLISAPISQTNALSDENANTVSTAIGTATGMATFSKLRNENYSLTTSSLLALGAALTTSGLSYAMLIEPNTIRIGYLQLKGVITNSAYLVKQIEEFEENPSIKGLIIKVESPGGLPGSSQAILHALNHFKAKKPIVALVENCCASGAYYAICGANKIISTPSAIIGSIGVVMRAHNIKDLLESWQIKNTVLQAGEYKTTLDPLKAVTPSDVEFEQNIINDIYEQFVTDVAEQRGLDPADNKTWANGKVFTGRQALNLKLVDEIGSYRDALDAMGALLNTERENFSLETASNAPAHLFFGDTEVSASLAKHAADFCVNVYQQAAIQLSCEQAQPQV